MNDTIAYNESCVSDAINITDNTVAARVDLCIFKNMNGKQISTKGANW